MWHDRLILYKRKGITSSPMAQLSEGVCRVYDGQHSMSDNSHLTAQSSEWYLKSVGSGWIELFMIQSPVTVRQREETKSAYYRSHGTTCIEKGPGVLPSPSTSHKHVCCKLYIHGELYRRENVLNDKTNSPRARLHAALSLRKEPNILYIEHRNKRIEQ